MLGSIMDQGLSHWAGPTEVALIEETIGQRLRAAASAAPDHEALVVRHQDVRLSYSELDARVDELARGLLEAGLETGDRVGIWSPNNLEWVLTQFATARIGVVLVTLNPAYRTSEVEYALRQSGVRLLVAASSFKTSDYESMVGEIAGNCPALERTVFIGSQGWDGLIAGATSVSLDDVEQRSSQLSSDDPINLQYTSGTTGFPKGATLTHRNILNNGYFVGAGCEYTSQDRICIPVPFYHCFGMVMGNLGAISHGATMVIPDEAFDALSVLETCEAEACTSLYGVPTMFIAQLEHPDFEKFDLSSLRTGIMAGSPCPVEVMKQVIERMGMSEVTICYGMTETSPVSTQTGADDDIERRVSTVGQVHPHVEVKVVDPDSGEIVPFGEPGEFCTRGYSVMAGYWDDPEKTAGSIDTEGWMHSGDLATMDDAGYCNIVGRIKDMIIRGGENVYPREVEEFLFSHPDVADVQVIGVPDEKYGEEICAWVQLRAGSTLDSEGVREHCRGKIAHYKIPRYVLIRDGFPMTVTGKVQKFKMRDDTIAELGLAPEAETA
jgi:fatty-acyl-CoA synthase